MNKLPRRRRPILRTTVSAELYELLRAKAIESEIPMGRLLDHALRVWLGVPDPMAAQQKRAA